MIHRFGFLLLFLGIGCGWCPHAQSNEFYIRQNGSDTNDGLSWANARASTYFLNRLYGGNDTLQQGDTVRFGAGVYFNCFITPPNTGDTVNQPWTVYACSAFADTYAGEMQPFLFSGGMVTGWTFYEEIGVDTVWRGAWWVDTAVLSYDHLGSNGNMNPLCVTRGGTKRDSQRICGYASGGYGNLDEHGEYWWDEDSLYYYHDKDSTRPQLDSIIGGGHPIFYGRLTDGANYKLWGLSLRLGWPSIISGGSYSDHNLDSLLVEHCDIRFATAQGSSGSYGNPAVISAGGSDSADTHWKDVWEFRACSLGNSYGQDVIVMQGQGNEWYSTGFGYGPEPITTFYNIKNLMIESCYVAWDFAGLYAKSYCHDGIMRYNWIEGGTDFGVGWYWGMARCSTYGNIIVNCASVFKADHYTFGGDMWYLNNTAYGATQYLFYTAHSRGLTSGSGTNYFKFNVIHFGGVGTEMIFDKTNWTDSMVWSDENLYYDKGAGTWNYAMSECGSGSGWSNWQACGECCWPTGYDENSTYGTAPGFADSAAHDFARPSADDEMDEMYGDTHWTKLGAVQDAAIHQMPTLPNRKRMPPP